MRVTGKALAIVVFCVIVLGLFGKTYQLLKRNDDSNRSKRATDERRLLADRNCILVKDDRSDPWYPVRCWKCDNDLEICR